MDLQTRWIKMIVVGDEKVGKSNIRNRSNSIAFSEEYVKTEFTDYSIVRRSDCNLKMVDMPGEHKRK